MSFPAAPPKPLSVSTNPSLAPAAARAAAQDAQIAQLVQQNRSLEQSILQLRNQLKVEESRGIEAVNSIRDQWKAESKEWRDGCDAIQARHRLAHLATRVTLEHERGFRLEDKERLLQEKLAISHLEYKIILFQASETDRMVQIAELEAEIESQREELSQILSQHEIEVARLKAKLEAAEAHGQANAKQVGNVAEEMKAMESELRTLRSASTSDSKQIDRLKLQIESLQTQHATLETRNGELQHQVDKWQTLENKGEKAVEDLRKRNIELEVRVKELEVTLKESRAVEKKIAKLEGLLLEAQEQVGQSQQDIAEAQADRDKAQKSAAKLERQVEKLKAALEAEKANPVKERKEKSQNAADNQVNTSVDDEMDDVAVDGGEPVSRPPSRAQRSQSVRSERSHSKRQGKGKEQIEKAKDGRPKRSKPEELGKQPANLGSVSEEEEGEGEIKDMSGPSKPDEGHTDVDLGGEMDPAQHEMGESKMPEVSKQSRYRDKIALENQLRGDTASEKEADDDPKRSTRRGKTKELESDVEGRPSRKRAVSQPPRTGETQDTDVEAAKKKKRKLNISGGTNIFSNPAGFTWNQEGDDLGIPSVLSPIKEGQPVPSRIISTGSLGKLSTKGR